MKIERLSLGCKSLDDLLGGGLEYGVITNFYGEAGSGKSNLALIATKNVVAAGKKVIFIDTEGSYSIERINQISKAPEKVNSNTTLLEPMNFNEQHKMILELSKKISKEIGLVVLDSLVALYRIAMGPDTFEDTNRKLAAQLLELSKIARENKIPVLVTTQVYSDFNGTTGDVVLVSKDIAKYWSKCLVKLEKGPKNLRKAQLTRHRSRPEGLETNFFIVETGVESRESEHDRLF